MPFKTALDDQAMDRVGFVLPEVRQTETARQMALLSDDGRLPAARGLMNDSQVKLWDECHEFHRRWATAKTPAGVYSSNYNKNLEPPRTLDQIRDRVQFFEFFWHRYEPAWNPAGCLHRLSLLRKMCWQAMYILMCDMRGQPLSKKAAAEERMARAERLVEKEEKRESRGGNEGKDRRRSARANMERELTRQVRKRQAAQKFPNMALTYLAVEKEIASMSAKWSSTMLERRAESIAETEAERKSRVSAEEEKEIAMLRKVGA